MSRPPCECIPSCQELQAEIDRIADENASEREACLSFFVSVAIASFFVALTVGIALGMGVPHPDRKQTQQLIAQCDKDTARCLMLSSELRTELRKCPTLAPVVGMDDDKIKWLKRKHKDAKILSSKP